MILILIYQSYSNLKHKNVYTENFNLLFKIVNTCIYETDWPMKLLPILPISPISADVANPSTNINDSVILVSVMDFTDVPMLKIWPVLADTDTDINIGGFGASLLFCSTTGVSCKHMHPPGYS